MVASTKYAPRVLAQMPATQAQLRERTGFSDCIIRDSLRHLRETRQCHIGGYQYVGTRPQAIHHPGEGKDVKSTPPGRKSKRVEPVREPALVRIRRDPLVAALFGEVPPC